MVRYESLTKFRSNLLARLPHRWCDMLPSGGKQCLAFSLKPNHLSFRYPESRQILLTRTTLSSKLKISHTIFLSSITTQQHLFWFVLTRGGYHDFNKNFLFVVSLPIYSSYEFSLMHFHHFRLFQPSFFFLPLCSSR